jgi:pimeloyl-ACP methyl ester carboxylesterase
VVAGNRVLFHVRRGGAAMPVVVDPETGEVVPLELPAGVQEAVPIIAAGDTVLVGVAVAGRHRLAMVSLRDPGRFAPLDALDHLQGAVQPLALHPAGTELLLRLRRGARSRLLRHRFTTWHTEPITTPPGTAGRPAAWTAAGLWLPFTSTTAPATLWWLPAGGAALRAAPGIGAAVAGGRPGRVEEFPGPAGPVEAVGYGDWRHADRVMLALHGGPAERWSLTFVPALQEFASAGLAVVAPNPRGSTGYGCGYEEAIKGAWGGPDLADVLAVGAFLVRERGPGRPLPAVYGTSYGAFLGLLALAEAPQLWSGCVAVAPFLSGARLYPDAIPPVRALLDRLAGATVVNGASGPRDLLRQAPRMRGRVLVVHGERDPTIPVGHSRELVAALTGRPGFR